MSQGSDPTIQFTAPDSTTVIPAVNDPNRPATVALTFLAVAAAAFLAGIAAASTVRDAPEGVQLVSQTVGPGGGTIRFEGGEIRVPSGAVSGQTRIVVRRTTVAERVRIRPPGRPVQVYDPGELHAYIFEPAGLEFLRPVTLRFRIGERDGDAAAFARVGEATLQLGGEVDPDGRTLSIEVSDFRFTRGQPASGEDG